MSEPNGDSSQNPPPAPSNPGTEGAAPSNLSRAPRANPPSVFNQKDAPPPAAPPGFAELMAWMQTMGSASAPATPAEEEAQAGRTLIPKEQKKFSRRNAEPPKLAASGDAPVSEEAGSSGVPTSPVAPAPGEKPAIASPLRSLPPDLLTAERKRRSKEGTKSVPVLLLTQLLAFGLIVASFFVGRATVPKTTANAPVAAPAAPVVSSDGNPGGLLPPELAGKVEQSLTAEAEGDPRKAAELLQGVKAAGGRLNGLDFHLAMLAYATGDFTKVLPLLNESIANGEEVAASYNLRGTLTNRLKGMNAGFADMEMAANLDPFNARYSFFVGEAMRRQGKTQSAVPYLKRAIAALREPLLAGFYQLKLRLALIELGQEKEFSDEMASQLALNPPPIDWLFTAAAAEMHRGNFTAAAALLDKAKALNPESDMQMRLRDFYFYGFANEKLLARFYEGIKRSIPPSNQPFSTNNPFEKRVPAPKPAPVPEGQEQPTATPPVIDVPATGNVPKLP